MKGWNKEESQKYMERFRGYRGDTRCKKCGWFGHMTHHCRREEIEAEREQRGWWFENRWKPLKCRVMACKEERMAVHSTRREVQQEVECWGYREVGHCLWKCPKKAAYPEQGKVQQKKLVCRECKGENHVVRNCNSYWRWREREVKKKLRELKEREQEKSVGKERVLRHTMQPLREVWIIGMEKVDTHEGVMVKALLDNRTTGMFVDKKFVERNGFKLEKLERPSRVTNVDGSHNSGGLIIYEIECNVYCRDMWKG